MEFGCSAFEAAEPSATGQQGYKLSVLNAEVFLKFFYFCIFITRGKIVFLDEKRQFFSTSNKLKCKNVCLYIIVTVVVADYPKERRQRQTPIIF